MHPEWSLIVLTVFAGVGQGIFTWLVLLLAASAIVGPLPEEFILHASILSLVFPLIGMMGSFFHLGRPERGIKAILKFRQSWLSREVVFLPAFVGCNTIFAGMTYLGMTDSLRLTVGIAGALFSAGLYASSAMLYAKISFIREWANPFTVSNFFVFGLLSGLGWLIFAMALPFYDIPVSIVHVLSGIAAGLGALATILKGFAFSQISSGFDPITLRHAIGVSDPTVKLQDMGTSYPHYNTKEYHYEADDSSIGLNRGAVLFMGFILPAAIWLLASAKPKAALLPLAGSAAVFILLGLIFERWLFFVEGNHIQNLYYGLFRERNNPNPILVDAKNNFPDKRK